MAAKRIDSWVVSDEFWARVEPLVPKRVSVTRKAYVRKPGAGRPPKPARQVFEAVVYVLRTGQWKALPKERFGSASVKRHQELTSWRCGRFLGLEGVVHVFVRGSTS